MVRVPVDGSPAQHIRRVAASSKGIIFLLGLDDGTFSEKSVTRQVDLGNARLAGADPIALLRRYPGRAISIHVKDCRPGAPDILLGGSGFDWAALFRVCESTAATAWYVIEHESKDLPSLTAAGENLRRFQKLRNQ